MRSHSASRLSLLLVACALGLSACGDEEEAPVRVAEPTPEAPATQATPEPEPETTAAAEDGTEIVLASSEFGDMLFGADRQAIYIFERDGEDESVCYGECAEAWPPVYTEGEPVAGKGVDADLLGTTERRDGRLQVTYAGKPLYFYAHEGPGEVRCHNINLNGGFWWVVGADGERRP